jgi:hypothetical protein
MMVSSDLHMAKAPAQVSSDTKQEALSMVQLLEGIENTPLDRQSIPQESLDLANKLRASLFPWRGQFSPELVELFLNHYSQDTSVILDPFAGSGTTLFEATRKGLVCYTAEINPSAIEMARTAHFSNLSLAQRKDAIQVAVTLAEECIHPFTWDLFSYQNLEHPPQSAFGDSLESVFNNLIKPVLFKNLHCSKRQRHILSFPMFSRKKPHFMK